MKAVKDEGVSELPFLYGAQGLLQRLIWQFKEGMKDSILSSPSHADTHTAVLTGAGAELALWQAQGMMDRR